MISMKGEGCKARPGLEEVGIRVARVSGANDAKGSEVSEQGRE